MLRPRPTRVLLWIAPLALLLAACGDDDEEPEASGTTETTEAAETAAGTDAETSDVTVALVDSEFGQILASDSRTLYLFMPDNAGAPTCYDDCAQNWPPLLAEGAVTTGEGLDPSLFATVPRDTGGEQVTVDGWPLYFFANDAAPGDVNGQGVGEVWYVVGPDGGAIQGAG